MRSSTAAQSSSSYDLSFKILLIGDSGVGKSSLLLSFISNAIDDITPTIGTITTATATSQSKLVRVLSNMNIAQIKLISIQYSII